MKTNNRISFVAYISFIFLFNLIAATVFYLFVYNDTYTRFDELFIIIYFVSVLLGAWLYYKNNRTIISSAFIVIVPFGLYSFISEQGLCRNILLIIFLVAFCILAFRFLFRRMPRGYARSSIIRIRVNKLLRCCHYIFGIVSIILMMCIMISNVISTCASLSENEKTTPQVNSSISFSIDDWYEGNESKRIEYAQEIVDYECEKLDTIPLTIVASSSMRQEELASYSNKRGVITINKKHLLNGELLEIINSICHEVRHSWQYSLIFTCKNYDGKKKINKDIVNLCTAFKSEFKNYVSYNADDSSSYYQYMWQKSECNSRQYAETESQTIYSILLSHSF